MLLTLPSVLADVVSDVILREDLSALTVRLLDSSTYTALAGIFTAWLRVKISILGLTAVGVSLQTRELLAYWQARLAAFFFWW